MSQYSKLIGNSAIFAIGNLGSKLITFGMLPLYTAKLTTKEYGAVDLVITTVSLLLPIISLSIYDSVLRFAMDKSVDKRKLYSNAAFVTGVGSFLMIIIASILMVSGNVLTFLPMLLVLQSYQNLFSQYAKGIGRVKLFASNGIILSFLTAILNVIFLVPLEMGLNGYLISMCLAFLISDIYLFLSLKLKSEFKFELIDRKYSIDLLKFSIPLIPNAIAWWLTTAVGRYFILFFVGASGNGLFAVANKIPTILTVFSSIFSQSWQISAIEEFDSKNRSEFFSNVYSMYSQALVVGCSFILLFLQNIFQILVDKSFYISWRYAPFLLLSVLFSSLSAFLGSQYVAAKNTVSVFKTTILGAGLNVLLNCIFVPLIGLNGVGLGSLFSFFLVWAVRERDLQKYFEFTLNKKMFVASNFFMILQVGILFNFGGLSMYIFNSILFLVVLWLNRNFFVILISSILKKKQ